MLLRKFFLPLIVLIVALGCSSMEKDHMVLSGTIEADSVHAGSRVGGRVKEVKVDEGSQVKQGDILLILEDNVLMAQKAQLEASLVQAEAAYNVVAAGAKPEDIARAQQQAEVARQSFELAQAGPLPEDIAVAENQAEGVHAAYQNAQDAADRMERLFNEGVVPERDFVAARQAAETARKQWEAAAQQVESLKSRPREQEVAAAKASYLAALDAVRSLQAGATREQLDSADAAVQTARKAVDRIQVDLAETTVTAPGSGLLKSFNLKPGDFVAPGQPVGEIVDLSALKVKIYVPENRLGLIREGMELPVQVDSFPGETFKGSVSTIAAEAEFTPRNVQTVEERVTQVFAVTVAVSNPDLKLRPGMAADVTVMLKQK